HRKNIIFTFLYHYLYIFAWVPAVVLKCNKYAMGGLQWFVKRIYAPCLHWVLLNRSIFCAGLISLLIFTFGLVWSGTIPYVFFPKTDGNEVQATVKFPNGTPAEVTDYWTKLMEQKFWEIADEYERTKEPVAVRSFRVVGTTLQSRGHNMGGSSGGGSGHTGGVQVELISGDQRTVSSMEISDRWREAVGVIPGADEVEFTSQAFGPPGGAIEFMLVAKAEDYEKLEAAVEEAKKHLATFAGVIDITDSDVPGKWEFQLTIKEHAKSLGIHPQQLAETMRAAYYGAEVERLQRGRHEVKLMVCYPREDRRSLADFDEVRVRGNDGVEYPITEIADIEVKRGYTTISRHSQMRSITVSADVEEGKANAQNITSQLKAQFLPQLMKDYPGVKVRWEGREDMKNESMSSMYVGFIVAMFAMYIILSLEFKSYVQPLLILAIIPFGVIGAVFIHAAFGQPLSQFSLFGMVALSGIVVNDSIVLIDFLNRAIESGEPVHDALMNVGQRRFTSVMLTSVTTVGGLLPLIMETSLQAQMLIPMALTISGGVMSSLILVLFFIPVLYSYYIDGLKLMGINIRRMLIHNDNLEAEPEVAAE
ncbi:MAG: efflux RND transporter permease subunit, partial [Thermoguttaceae bacterium]|nr:efflux RND transporter permease subunit [Thermoguttaceae bacterium]